MLRREEHTSTASRPYTWGKGNEIAKRRSPWAGVGFLAFGLVWQEAEGSQWRFDLLNHFVYQRFFCQR